MSTPLDSFILQLQHRVWTQLLPLGFVAMAVGVLVRCGVEKLAAAFVRLLRGKPKAAKGNPGHAENDDAILDANPYCPECRRPMVRRTARRGENRGSVFWGCAGFPQCRGMRRM